MNATFKQLLRPSIKTICKLWEAATGFQTDPDGYLPNRVRMLAGIYEPEVCKLMASKIPVKGVFVDVGANVGYVTKYILAHSCPSKITCIEANIGLIPILKSNLSRFDRVHIVNAALSDKNGTSFMYVGKDSAVGSLTEGYAQAHHQDDPRWSNSVRPILVNTMTGDEFFTEASCIDLMKIDIEGHELPALYGMQSLFDMHKIKCVLFEFSPLSQKCASREPLDLLNFFLDRGFSVREAEGEFRGRVVDKHNAASLIGRLGARGYTSLLAELRA